MEHEPWSLRRVCELLNIDLPESLLGMADGRVEKLTSKWSPLGKPSIHFDEGSTPEQVDRLKRLGVQILVDTGLRHTSDGLEFPTLVIPNPVDAYVSLMRYVREQSSAKTIAITGSNGKTTCREMIRLVAGTTKRTHWSKANGNVLGLIGSFIQDIPNDAEVYVQETGAYKPGLIKKSGEMLAPDAALITNIGMAHVGEYGSQEAVLADKLSLDKHLPNEGVFFVNFDNEILRSRKFLHQTVSYGVENSDVDYAATNIERAGGGLSFDVIERATGTATKVLLHVVGDHNVSNALAAFAVGRWLEIDHEDISRGLAEFRTEGTRQNLTTLGGREVLVDCFNSTELAVLSVAETLSELKVSEGGKRVLVLGEIPRLGEHAESVHRMLGDKLAENKAIAEIYCIDDSNRWLVDEAKSKGANAYFFETKGDLHKALAHTIGPGDAVAFKAGSPSALATTVDRLFGTDFTWKNSGYYRTSNVEVDGIQYRLVRGYGARVQSSTQDRVPRALRLGGDIAGQPLLMVGRYAFARSDVESVILEHPIRGLGLGAFYKCENLKHVTLPGSLRYIGQGAFNGCTQLESVAIPEGVTTIRRSAFRDCVSLTRLVLPRSLRTLDPGTFIGSPNVIVHTYRDAPITPLLKQRLPARRLVILDQDDDGI